MFVNTLTASDKYFLFNGDILTQPIAMQLSKKQKAFCQCNSALLESRSNFEDFKKKHDPHRSRISRITNYEMPS